MMRFLILVFTLFTVLVANPVETEEAPSLYFDSEDGQVDLSNYLSQAYGFLPLPIVITEPAVGYGLGLGLVYLHDNLDGTDSQSGRNVPPSVSGVVGLGTENGTKAGGVFHMGHWLDDTLRTSTALFYFDVNMNLYTSNGNALV